MPHTIPFNEPWEAATTVPGRYAPTRPQGKRVPGWEDVNVTLLAQDIHVSFRYLLAVLCGQRNCTLALLQRTARALGMGLPALVQRMENAYRLRLNQSANAVERRRLQSTRRAILGR